MGWCNVRRFISIVMLKFLVTLGTWQCLWLSRVTLACGDCEIAVEPIASHSDAFHLLRAKGRGWVLLVFAHHLSLQRTIFQMQLCHTHTTLHIQLVLLLDPPPPPLSFLPSPSPLQHVLLNIGRSWLVGLSGPLILDMTCNLFSWKFIL